MSDLRERIRWILDHKKWSAAELNRRAGLTSPTHVTTILNRGGTRTSQETVFKIAQGAEVSPWWLWTGEGSPDVPGTPPPTELRMVPDGDARPSLGAHPDAEALANEIREENPALSPYLDIVLSSGSMRSLDIPLTRAALETLAKVVQSHGQRRGR